DQATATLVIDIIDDVPTARNDVDSVTEGGPLVADGNVLTGTGGSDANNTDGVADTVGADDADLTGFSQGSNNGTLGVPFAAQHGTLVLNADGSYTYTLNPEDPAVIALTDGQTLTEVFTYTLTDGDGDVDTATLTITIIGTNDAPTIGSSAVAVSEEGLEGVGIPDNSGSDDTTNSATASGTVPVADADGDSLTVTLSTSGLPNLTSNSVPIVWAVSNGGHTLTGTAGGETIIQIVIQDDGDYTVTLSGPVDHANPAIEDDLSFDIAVSVSDGAETTTGGKITVTIEDDSPVVTGQGAQPQLLADESDFTTNDTKNFGDAFDIAFGGDGGSPNQVTYQLGTPGGDSGFVDTLTNEAVVLTLEAGTVVGRAGAGGPIVFVVSVDSNGDVTVDQQRSVVHDDPNDPNDSKSLADDNLITLTATAEDNDGDTGSATINIGKNVSLADDGPEISRNGQGAPDLFTDDTDVPNGTDSASFAGLFTGAFGNDGFKDSDDNDVQDSDAITYSLSLKDGPGTDSNLNDVLTGDNILLRIVGNTIEGYLQNDTGVVAFTLTLDPATGVITQDQLRAITHDDPTDPDEIGNAAQTMAGNLIVLTATITDGDGDHASATADIGDSFHFEDDGPDAFNEAQQDVQEGQTISGTFDFDPGEDGATVTHINGTVLNFDVGTGWSQWIAVDDGQIRAKADGSYEFQAENNADGVTSGTFTVTDGDGDPDTANWAFNITDANSPTAGASSAKVDDDGLTGNNPASNTGDIDANVGEVPVVNTNEAIFHGDLNAEFGGDGAGTISFAGMVGQFRMVGTERVNFTWDPATLTLHAF
ncbi:MAG TPA: DUF5801 repeats-in-toxin domain-containing protein, partial [Vicinamibacterales bacterium]